VEFNSSSRLLFYIRFFFFLGLKNCIAPKTKGRYNCPNAELVLYLYHIVAIPVKWSPPPLGWFKLNTHGSSLGNPGLAGGGSVIRNHLGGWVGGFSQAIDFTTSVQIELRALKDSLLLAIDLGILNLEIEIDSLIAVELINSSTTSNAFLSTVVDDYKYLLERFELSFLKHIFREANGCTYLLAKAGYAQ
jgi:ribonuclease HI